MNKFSIGFKTVLGSFKYLLKPGIRLFAILPILINTLLFSVAIIYSASSLNEFINNIISRYEWLEWFTWLLWPLFIIIAFTVIFFCFTIIANLIGAPFNGFLAEAVEKHLTGADSIDDSGLSLMNIIIQTIKSESQKLLYIAIRSLPLLILFIIPMVQTVAPFIWFLFGAWMLALEYLDYPMGNHDIIFAEQRDILKNNRQLGLGFGVGVVVITMIPVVNFIAMPVAVIAATRLYLEHLKHQNRPSLPDQN